MNQAYNGSAGESQRLGAESPGGMDMYGMVNRAIEEYVRAKAGDEGWLEVARSAGLSSETFVSMEPYPDKVSFDLVGATCQKLGLPASVVLEDLGVYWIEFAQQQGYANLLRLAGDNLPDILRNLDNLHARVRLNFTELQMPTFWCTDDDGSKMTVHYRSIRAGLSYFVIGLFHGLAKMLAVSISVEQTKSKSDGADHDEFLVTYRK